MAEKVHRKSILVGKRAANYYFGLIFYQMIKVTIVELLVVSKHYFLPILKSAKVSYQHKYQKYSCARVQQYENFGTFTGHQDVIMNLRRHDRWIHNIKIDKCRGSNHQKVDKINTSVKVGIW